MPILVVKKAVIWQLYVVYAYVSYKKGSIKNIIFWSFCRHEKIKTRVHVHCPYMDIDILPKTLSFLVQSQIFLYRDAQDMIIYQIGYFWVGDCIIKFSSRRRPFTGAAVEKLLNFTKSPFYGWEFLVNPITKPSFPKYLGFSRDHVLQV